MSGVRKSSRSSKFLFAKTEKQVNKQPNKKKPLEWHPASFDDINAFLEIMKDEGREF